MNGQFNPWWTLPVLSLVAGLAVGYKYFSITPQITPKKVEQTIPVESSKPELTVVNVALPPAPVEYQPVLSAKLVNNQVVVKKEQAKTVGKSQEQPVDTVAADNNSILAQRFNQVLADMQKEQEKPKVALHPQPLTRYPQWYQDLVPPLEFSEHIYSSKLNESRVRVNNQVVKEGELINDRMRIVKIEPQQVIIQLQERQFSLPALSSW